MWNVKFLVKDFFQSKSLQEFVNRRFKDKDKIILEKEYVNYVVMKNGDLFYMSDDLDSATTVYQDYVFDDIRRDDIVIDIGANIGGFSLPASRLSDNVYAVEPITTQELRKNISLNNANITVIESALGDGSEMNIDWHGTKRNIKTMSLSQIIDFCGGCDFLKCDCEGGEWFIKEEEIKDIRRIEMEYHCYKSYKKADLVKMLSTHFTVKVDSFPLTLISRGSRWKDMGIIHAMRKNR